MGKKRKTRYGQCAYCRQEGMLTEDHVIPQCLFSEGVPSDAPIVYACYRCNNTEKSQDDTYLRDMLVRDGNAASSKIAQAIRQGPFLRSMEKGHSTAIMLDVITASISAKFLELGTPSGLLFQQSQLPEDQIKRILTRIVCGLSKAYIGHRPPENPSMVIRARDLAGFEAATKELLQSHGQRKVVGDGSVFWCVYSYSTEKPDLSMWFLCFYEHVAFFVAPGQGWTVTPPAKAENA